MLEHMTHYTLPDDWDRFYSEFPADAKGLHLRESSSQYLKYGTGCALVSGDSADLATSCLTSLKSDNAGDFMPPASDWESYNGRNVHCGIREHAMS